MKILTVIIIYLDWFSSAFVLDEDLTKDMMGRIQTLKSILNNDLWRLHIIHQDIIFNGEISKLNLEFERILKSSVIDQQTYVKNKKDYTSKLYDTQLLRYSFEMSKLMYIALECKYSELIFKSFLFLFYSNTISEIFSTLKKHYVRLMYNLFTFRDLYPNLKFADQTLIISLLSINIYFHHFNHQDVIEHMEIAQMVNLLEYFRCSNCLIPDHDYYRYPEFYEDMEIFNSISQDLKIYSSDVGIDQLKGSEMPKYDDDIYNLKNLVVGHIFEKYPSIHNIGIKWKNNVETFITIYEKSIKSHDIKDIFDYQMLLIDVIRDLFCIQFLKVIGNSFKLNRTMDDFDIYLKQIIPNNYPPNLYDSIKTIQNAIKSNTKNQKKTNKLNRIITILQYKLKPLKKNLKTYLKINTVVLNEQSSIFIKNGKMTEFIQDIVNYKYFKIFILTFQLFLSESNRIENYRILKSNPNTGDFAGCNNAIMSNLRENLYLFRSLIAGRQQAYYEVKKTNGPDFATLSSMMNIKKNLAYVYDKFNENDEIMKIITPITINLKNATYSVKKYILAKQYLLLTINLIESYEIRNCSMDSEKLNLNIYNRIMRDENMRTDVLRNIHSPADFNVEYIQERIRKRTIKFLREQFYEDVEDGLMWVDTLIPNGYLYYYDSKFNSKHVFWNGIVVDINSVSSSITEYVFHHKYFFEYQVVILKWLICNVFKKLLYIVNHIHRFQSTATTLSTINAELQILKTRLRFPRNLYIKTYINTIFDVYNLICINYKDMALIQNGVSIIIKQIELLKIIDTEDYSTFLNEMYSLDIIHNSILDDIKFSTEIIKFFNQKKLLFSVYYQL